MAFVDQNYEYLTSKDITFNEILKEGLENSRQLSVVFRDHLQPNLKGPTFGESALVANIAIW